MTRLQDRLRSGAKIIRKAGGMALSAFHDSGVKWQEKGPGDLVTQADLDIEAMIRAQIARDFADDAVVGEEGGGAVALQGHTWLIDPIDGTVNFARKIGYFCISLALLRDGLPVAAWICDPVLDELFFADADRKATLNGKPIHVSTVADPQNAVIGLGFSPRHRPDLAFEVIQALTGIGAEHRRFGAGALCLAHVAAGRLEAYAEPHMNNWDAVGGLYIASCAGATTLDYIGLGGLSRGAVSFAAAPSIAPHLLASLPAPFQATTSTS
jgi:myo-inositol-1(or 4)-monophosphatase